METKRTRVNGALLQQFHAKPISIFGIVVKGDGGGSGSAFQIKTSDNVTLNVRMKTPPNDTIDGLIEVYGIGQGKSLVLGDAYTLFPETLKNTFDFNLYNEALNLIHSLGDNPWLDKE